jgi:hypothetical protein
VRRNVDSYLSLALTHKLLAPNERRQHQSLTVATPISKYPRRESDLRNCELAAAIGSI